MTDGPSHSTLREWRRHMARPQVLAALLGTSVVLALVAPFDTGELLRLVPRFGYWLAIVFSTYSAGVLVNRALARWTDLSGIASALANGVATGCAVAVMVLAINAAALGHWPTRAELPPFLGNVFVIAVVIAVVIQVAATPEAARAPAPPPILDRLPYDKRGALLALSVEDHYVRVRTSKGAEMVLMRLGDAMREVGDTGGLQIHRSHWVAKAAVTAARRDGDRAILTLVDGSEIPVSRRYVPAIREAGLLPR